MIIPAFNEADALPGVLAELARHNPDHDLVVVDDGSTDDTAVVARAAGATCLRLPFNLGIGGALRLGFRYAVEQEYDRAYQFDADGQHDASQVGVLLADLADADMVIGSRILGQREPGALPPQAYWGNKLACFLMRILWGIRHTDLGPFRAIRRSSLDQLGMRDRNFGWTIEMQIKAHTNGLRVLEEPVSYRRRTGVSKISGTISGAFKAGYKILYTIFRYRLSGS